MIASRVRMTVAMATAVIVVLEIDVSSYEPHHD